MFPNPFRVYLFVFLLFGSLLNSIAQDSADKSAPATRPNILIITVDDMSADSVGVYGSKLEGTTPSMDQLAAESLKFEYAHVQVGNCYPSRNVMWSGLYPHNSGVEGFYQFKDATHPTLPDILQNAGYFVGIRGKVSHSSPYQPYHWDIDLTRRADGTQEHIKDVESYGRSTSQGIANAKEAGKPFCINVNISDPHKPFWKPGDKHPASKEFTPEEVPIPGFLVDDPIIRKELSEYYTSVRRADDAVASILDALDQSGEKDSTVVIFLSDHGMPLPFAKTQLYHHSTHTPLLVRWPGVTKAGSIDDKHMVSAVDFMPTICEIAGITEDYEFDGRSFASLLKGEDQKGRDAVFKVYNENSGGARHPMRAVETRDYLYIFNPWSNGTRKVSGATLGTAAYKQMKKLGATDPKMAARIKLFDYRELEEFYDMKNDPDCLVNLIDSPDHQEALKAHREVMTYFLEETNDHAAVPFRGLGIQDVMDRYMEKVEAESAERRKNRPKKQKNPKGNQKGKGQNKGKAAAKKEAA